MSKQNSGSLVMGGPAIYRICVLGRVDASWSPRLEGMNIKESGKIEEKPETTLTGRVADQAALAGVLSTLYELHLPVLSVECLETV
jgi:hypothetical protein